MKTEIIKDKQGKVLKTKEGVELQKFEFEVGDSFIPSFNRPIVNKVEGVNSKTGKTETYEKFKLKCKVRNSEGVLITDKSGSSEIFVDLTPSQYNTIIGKLEKDDIFEPNQHLWSCYEYKNSKGSWVGIGIKGSHKKPKDFGDFEPSNLEQEE